MYLPEELVVNILNKSSEAFLARSRCVSKRWKALIKDVILEEKRSHATVIMLIGFRVYLASINNKAMVADQLSLKDPLSKSSEEVKIRNVFHCDGLLLCSTEDNRLVVWNPCSREIRWSQPRSSYMSLDYFALGKTSCNKYKILRMQQIGGVVEYEIYNFTSSSWRVLGKTKEWFIQMWKGRGMYVKGNTYWLASNRSHGDLFLQSFDFSTESFRNVSLPGVYYSYQNVKLSVTREEQQLCLLTPARKPFIDVWIATKIESNGEASWIKFLSVTFANIREPFYFCDAIDYLVDPLNKVLMCRHGVYYTLHVLGENKSIQVDHHDAKSECKLLVNYVPSLVQIL